MTSTDIAMLISGIVLLVVALGLVMYCVLKSKPYKPLLVMFPIAIIMIGFPSIKSFNMFGVDVEKQVSQAANDLQKHPNSTSAVASYRQTMGQIDEKYPVRNQLPTNIRSSLASTARMLQNNHNLSPESRVALSHTELILGQTYEAKTNLLAALKADPNLKASLSPTLKSLLETPAR